MMKEEFKFTEVNDLKPGLSKSGKIRSAMLLGPRNGMVSDYVTKLGNSILQDNPDAFWVCIDSSKSETPYDWCSQFARNLRTNTGVSLKELAKFALNTGKSLSPFKPVGDLEGSPQDVEKMPGELISHFEQLINQSPVKNDTPHLILAINNLGDYSDEMLAWLSGSFNSGIRKSKAFKGCRFIFTSEQVSERENTFFDSFGFEKVHVVEIEANNPKKGQTSTKLVENNSNIIVNAPSGSSHHQGSISPKPLKKNALPCKLIGLGNIDRMDLKDAEKLLSPFNEEEKGHLFLASYPTRISRYSLEHFESYRKAALCFNWLKRASQLRNVDESGDLLLKEELRVAARTLHTNQFPEISDKWTTLASVFDTFHQYFPADKFHWIPINLQLLESFDKRILRHIFVDEDELSDVLKFIKLHEDQIVEKGTRETLSDETKLIIRRYMELSGKSFIPGLNDRIQTLWLKDLENYKIQKAKMLEEKESITSEIKGTLEQVANLEELKDNLTDNFRNPNRNKSEKIYSFSTSRALILIGLGTVGISLFADSVGSYHAACGLALTLFGYFWPNVEVKRTALVADGPRSNLAIETQHRSLNHRVGSLSNRVQIMKGNLDSVDKHLTKLGEAPPPPYLETDSEESVD